MVNIDNTHKSTRRIITHQIRILDAKVFNFHFAKTIMPQNRAEQSHIGFRKSGIRRIVVKKQSRYRMPRAIESSIKIFEGNPWNPIKSVAIQSIVLDNILIDHDILRQLATHRDFLIRKFIGNKYKSIKFFCRTNLVAIIYKSRGFSLQSQNIIIFIRIIYFHFSVQTWKSRIRNSKTLSPYGSIYPILIVITKQHRNHAIFEVISLCKGSKGVALVLMVAIIKAIVNTGFGFIIFSKKSNRVRRKSSRARIQIN